MKKYKSITYGILTEQEVFSKIAETLKGHEKEYKVAIGTDSQSYDETNVVAVILLYRIGKGGIFFRRENHLANFKSLREKIYTETIESIDLAKRLIEFMYLNEIDISLKIDVDIGANGKTSELINEIMGFVRASGFEGEYKPNSIAASVIADRYSK